MTEIRVPKLNNNDAQYVLVEWIAKDGAPVRRGDPLAVLETSKATEEITAEGDGLLAHLLAEGADCEPGQLIARLSPTGLPPLTLPAPDLSTVPESPAALTTVPGSPAGLSTEPGSPAGLSTGPGSAVGLTTVPESPAGLSAVLSPADLASLPASPAALVPADLPAGTGVPAPADAPPPGLDPGGRPLTGPTGPPAPEGGEPLRPPGGPVITSKARALMERYGISDEAVRALGKKIVRESDVESLAAGPPRPGTTTYAEGSLAAGPQGPGTTTYPEGSLAAGAPEPGTTADARGSLAAGAPGPGAAADAGATLALSRAQRRTADVVALSHRTIPPAYTVMKVDIGPALAEGRARTRELRTLIGPTELLVRAIASLHDRFPLFFATPVDGGSVRPSEAAHVGVTFDVGKGLVIPVVRDAAALGLKEISRTLLDFRVRAMRGELREKDLGGANIVLTLHNEPGVVLAVPIVFPGHTCALALAAPHPEVVPDGDGGFTAREVVHIGAAYDHRVLNGRDVILFLTALRDALAFPGGTAS
ncbi:2-oxo acid dehydrogenase subunit E2 [Sphaerisporangium sp. B11E5]|uniref:2-oxo acid dehydrogenase subunit E2 n=1 Tax=Sphaerisporangium sp. B11E5 TaxID=3153563 RepID=UPI00325D1085